MSKRKVQVRKLVNGHATNKEQFKQVFGRPIEEYEAIKRAVTALGEETKKNYYWQLAPFFIFINEDPDTVLKNRKEDMAAGVPENEERYERQVKLYSKHLLLSKGYTGRSTQGVIGRIQGFFANNSKRLALDLKNEIKLPKARRFRKYSPENKEVRMLFERADCARDKLIISIMYQNGLSPIDVAALNVEDYPLEPWNYFERSRSKTGEIIRAVSMPDACIALKVYLKIRGETAGPLLKSREGILSNKAITQIVSNLIQNVPELNKIAGFKPTNLRDAFEDSLKSARIYHKTKEAMMGHNSGIEAEYGGYKQMMESFVEAAKSVYPFLALNDFGLNNGNGLKAKRLVELENSLRESEKRLGTIENTNEFLRKDLVRVTDKIELVDKMINASGVLETENDYRRAFEFFQNLSQEKEMKSRAEYDEAERRLRDEVLKDEARLNWEKLNREEKKKF